MDFTIIRQNLIEEANTSPNMLSDIAGLETYISESYNNRSFIELLQNADDAKSSRFLVCKVGNYLLVANDGKVFDDQDLISLCRSASSGKERGYSIGYRGIGFKSVANFANEVHIISGEMNITFSRELTKSVIEKATRVPLIRIPHPIREIIFKEVKPVISQYIDEGYTTFFVFTGLIVDQIEDDYKNLSNSSLLFLHNIKEIKNELLGTIIKIQSKISHTGNIVEFFDSSKWLSSWILYRSGNTSIAFSKENRTIKALSRTDALVYSFLPTEDISGLGVLINSDFSTDPSRRHLIKDETTKNNIREVCELYKTIFMDNIFIDSSEAQSIIKSLVPYTEPSLVQFTGNHFEKVFASEIKNVLMLKDVVFRPSWLSSKDFNLIVKKLNLKSIDIEDGNPTLFAYLKYLGAKELTIDDINSTNIINSLNLSLSGCLQIASKLIKQSIFNVGFQKSDLINLRLFYSDNNRKNLLEINNENSLIDELYLDSLIDTGVSMNDIKSLFKKNNLSNLLLYLNKKNAVNVERITVPNPVLSEDASYGKYEPEKVNEEKTETAFDNWYKNIQSYEDQDLDESEIASVTRWRNTEQQVLYVLNKNGFHLSDVSKQNLGYDLEGSDAYGANVCIEVKSISYPGQSFKMTNNEYAVAQLKGNAFLIAVAYVIGSKLQLALYPNPTNRLKLNRQCVQWAWECDEYSFQPRVFEI